MLIRTWNVRTLNVGKLDSRGMVERMNWKGKRRINYVEQIVKDTGSKFSFEMKRLAYKREKNGETLPIS